MRNRKNSYSKCKKCKYQIFWSDNKCFKCGTTKIKHKLNKKQHMIRDWKCLECDYIVFVNKNKCIKCGANKPEIYL